MIISKNESVIWIPRRQVIQRAVLLLTRMGERDVCTGAKAVSKMSDIGCEQVTTLLRIRGCTINRGVMG